jgi:hypothetical protein
MEKSNWDPYGINIYVSKNTQNIEAKEKKNVKYSPSYLPLVNLLGYLHQTIINIHICRLKFRLIYIFIN